MAETARAPRWLTRTAYAHRGLHGPLMGARADHGPVPENSLAAFDRAIAGGYGIECDVRPATDGTPFVFHDARLERLTGVVGLFERLDSHAIAALRLGDGGAVPSLAAMLARVAGRVPILVEVKTGRPAPARFCAAVASVLDSYAGPVAVMSFDWRVADWFARHRRHLTRGLVVSARGHPPFMAGRRIGLAIRRARPHFLACDVRDIGRQRWCAGAALCWTVRSGAERRRARLAGVQIIFEAKRERHG